MAKNNKKPKFLEKETPELLEMLKNILTSEEVDEKKALKITEELISRQPSEDTVISVDEALETAAGMMTKALDHIKGAYDKEISLIEKADTSSDDEDDEEEEETPPKTSKSKKSKKSKKKEEEEEEEESEEDDDESEEDDDDDEDEEDYSDWSIKELKKECRTRGIKVNKSTSKADMVKALEADDKE